MRPRSPLGRALADLNRPVRRPTLTDLNRPVRRSTATAALAGPFQELSPPINCPRDRSLHSHPAGLERFVAADTAGAATRLACQIEPTGGSHSARVITADRGAASAKRGRGRHPAWKHPACRHHRHRRHHHRHHGHPICRYHGGRRQPAPAAAAAGLAEGLPLSRATRVLLRSDLTRSSCHYVSSSARAGRVCSRT
jgi:hypothetical protein